MPDVVLTRARVARVKHNLLAVLRHWFWLLGLCTLLGGVGAYMGSKLITPMYRATTLLVVGQQAPGSDLYNGVLASTQLIPTYMSLMTQQVVLQRAAAQVGGTSSQQLASQIHVTDQAGTQIIELDVDDASPVRAAQLANAIASTFVNMQQQYAAATLAQEQQQADQQLAQVSAEIRALAAQINAVRSDHSSDPRLQGLEQQLSTAQAQQTALQTTRDQLTAQAITTTNNISVFQAATPPPTPDHPKLLLNTTIGGALGLVIAAVLIWLLEFFDDRIHTPDQAEALLNLPALGAVGAYSGRSLLLGVSPNRKLAMDINALVAKMEMAHLVEPLRTIAVTSATHGEGRTTITVNLAIALARKGKRVLLVDGDLHQPIRNDTLAGRRLPFSRNGYTHTGIQDMLDSPAYLPSPFGLSLALTAQSNNAIDIPMVPSVRGLYFLPAGPSHPDASDLFRTDCIRHFLQRQLDRFDVIVLDTPPADIYPDAALLVRWVDATILVVDATRSDQQTVLRVKDLLLRTHASITGIVLNRAPAQERGVGFEETKGATYTNEPSDLLERGSDHSDHNGSVGPLAVREGENGAQEGLINNRDRSYSADGVVEG